MMTPLLPYPGLQSQQVPAQKHVHVRSVIQLRKDSLGSSKMCSLLPRTRANFLSFFCHTLIVQLNTVSLACLHCHALSVA